MVAAEPCKGRSPTERFGGLLAHLILVQSWTVAPFVPLLALVLVGAGHGPVAILGSASCFFAIFFGPPGFIFAGGVALVPTALALTAPEPWRAWALVGAFVFAACLYLINCDAFSPSESFYRLITETLNGAAYYDRAELRGALDEIKPGKNFFAAHPHGILCSGWSWNCIWNSEMHKRTGPIGFFIDGNLRCKNPLFRIVCDWFKGEHRYFAEATSERIKEAMERGDSVSLVPGGFHDATIMERGKERTMMKKRKGFIKYCLQYGYKVTPVYTFGESDTFATWTGCLGLRLWLNKWGIPAVAFFGNPFAPLFPRSDVSLLTYVGPPLQLPKLETPTSEDIDKWHGKYLEELTALFERSKVEAGRPDARLEIW